MITPGSGGYELPQSYLRWQQVLARAFFAGHAGVPVVLFVDRDELSRLAPELPDASADLCQAVSALVNPSTADRMFGPIQRAEAEWLRGSRAEPPPTLPLLAVSVLAASVMHRDSQGASHAYYIRLAQLLAPGAEAPRVGELRHTLREGAAFQAVAEMWVWLDAWLAEQAGGAGVSTIRDHPRWTRIGYPLSQALIRRSDRAVLTRFLAALDMPELGVPSGAALLSYLRIWAASRSSGLSETLQRALQDQTLALLLEPLLAAIAATWNGQVITSDGLRRLEIWFAVDLAGRSARWVIPRRPGFERDVLRGAVAGASVAVTMEDDPYSSLYRLEGAPPVTPAALRDGFRLTGSDCAAEFAPADVYPLVEDADAGGWLSVDDVRPYQEHVLIVVSDAAAQLQRALVAAADPGWRTVRQPPGMVILASYTIFDRVRFSDESRLNAALAGVPSAAAASHIRPHVVRPRLQDGLPVARHLARDCYLAGGEPDLLLPIATETREVEAALDGAPQVPPFVASGFPIPLRASEPLSPGRHELAVETEVLHFTITESPGLGEIRPDTATLGWDDQCALAAEGAHLAICGAEVSGDPPPDPILARRGWDYTWVIAHDGTAASIGEPASALTFETRAPGMTAYYFEVDYSPDAIWLVQRRDTRWRVVRLRERLPQFVRLDADSDQIWTALEPYDAGADLLWPLYVDAWRAARGR